LQQDVEFDDFAQAGKRRRRLVDQRIRAQVRRAGARVEQPSAMAVGTASFDCWKLINLNGNTVANLTDFSRVWVRHPHRASHSGLLEPRGTRTVLKDPGVFDRTTWSVMP
jgi:hypothetical protein